MSGLHSSQHPIILWKRFQVKPGQTRVTSAAVTSKGTSLPPSPSLYPALPPLLPAVLASAHREKEGCPSSCKQTLSPMSQAQEHTDMANPRTFVPAPAHLPSVCFVNIVLQIGPGTSCQVTKPHSIHSCGLAFLFGKLMELKLQVPLSREHRVPDTPRCQEARPLFRKNSNRICSPDQTTGPMVS